MNRCRAPKAFLLMKTAFPPANALVASKTPSKGMTVEVETRLFAGHRQYRYYSIHLPILLHKDDSISTIHPPSFGSGCHSPKESSLFPSFDGLCLNPFLVSACDLHSGNADECQYPESGVCRVITHAPVSLGASGLQGDSGVGAFEPCGLLDALPWVAAVLFTRCALAWVPDSLFTRCPRGSSGEGRFA